MENLQAEFLKACQCLEKLVFCNKNADYTFLSPKAKRFDLLSYVVTNEDIW